MSPHMTALIIAGVLIGLWLMWSAIGLWNGPKEWEKSRQERGLAGQWNSTSHEEELNRRRMS